MLVNLVLWIGPQVLTCITLYILSCHTHGKNLFECLIHPWQSSADMSWHAAFRRDICSCRQWLYMYLPPPLRNTFLHGVKEWCKVRGKSDIIHGCWMGFKPLCQGRGMVKCHIVPCDFKDLHI